MEIILRKGLYCETFGYLPPETRISLPADSDALGARLVERGYAKSVEIPLPADATWGDVVRISSIFEPPTFTIVNELPTDEAADDE